MEVNTRPGMSYSTIWECLKCYLRGLIISYSSHKNQEKKRRLKEISSSIAHIDSQYASDPSPELFEERQFLQAEYDILSTNEAEKLILRAQHRVYEHSERTGKLLARQIREAEVSRMIPQLRLQSGAITVNYKAINSEFKKFMLIYIPQNPHQMLSQ